MHRPNPSENRVFDSLGDKNKLNQELASPGKDYREAPHVSQGKRNHNMCGAVGQSALMATRTLFSMNDLIGLSLAYSFSPNRKMDLTEKL